MQQKNEVSAFSLPLGLNTEHFKFVSLIGCQILCQAQPRPSVHAVTPPPSPWAGITNRSRTFQQNPRLRLLIETAFYAATINQSALTPEIKSVSNPRFTHLAMFSIPLYAPSPRWKSTRRTHLLLGTWDLATALVFTLLLTYLVLDATSLIPQDM